MLKRTLSWKSYVMTEIKEKLSAQIAHKVGPIADGLLMAQRCVLAGWRPYDSRAIKRRHYFVSKYGLSNLYSM